MKSENLIHIKLEYSEAVQGKKDVLSSQMGILKIAKILKRYHALRSEELQTKTKLHTKLVEMQTSMRKMQTILPHVKIPEILQQIHEEIPEERERIEHRIARVKEQNYDEELENQLAEIQSKLRSLQAA